MLHPDHLTGSVPESSTSTQKSVTPGNKRPDSCPPWLHWHSFAHRGGIHCTDGGRTPGSPVTVSYPCLSLSRTSNPVNPGLCKYF